VRVRPDGQETLQNHGAKLSPMAQLRSTRLWRSARHCTAHGEANLIKDVLPSEVRRPC
jgi:hypothetical protein